MRVNIFWGRLGDALDISEKIARLVEKQSLKPEFPGVALSVYRQRDQFSFDGATGNLAGEKQFFIASSTKLYVTAILLKMVGDGQISLDDKISKYLPQKDVAGLHVYHGKEYSNDLSIANLMAHTSGLPDYFQQKLNGNSVLRRLKSGEDVRWSYQDTLQWTKNLPAKFPPDTRRKAFYSDSNYQILGRIIELHAKEPIADIMQTRIFDPLGLENTFLYINPADISVTLPNYGSSPLDIRRAMASFGPDGGIASTAREMMIFLRAFFEGKLFDAALLKGLYDWRKVMFPLQYGTGIMLFATPWYFSPFKKQPALMGHSGMSGAFAFYAPKNEIYLTGTVNQIAKPSASFQLMLKAMMLL